MNINSLVALLNGIGLYYWWTTNDSQMVAVALLGIVCNVAVAILLSVSGDTEEV